MNRDRTCASMRHPSPCRDKTRHLTTELSASTKKDASGTVTFKLAWIDQEVESLRTIKSMFLQDLNKLASNGSKKDAIWLKSINENRNKESSQTTLEAETDEARSKDLKVHVTENNEISNKEKSTTNLDLARDRQKRRKTWKHYNRWNEQGSNLRLDAAPIALPRQDQALNHWAFRIYKNRCFRNSDFHASLNRLRGWIAKNDQVHIFTGLEQTSL